ncbi:MAG: glycosyltransferase family 39 protein [Candidatus Eremiobacteraeota bacterium]|nr:glycosyltransferase family 39 protein [Candidatus Eremiobacteraeota bacterium]
MKRLKLYLLILLIFSIFFILVNYAWISLDRKVPILNNLVYLIMSQEYHTNLTDGDCFSFLINRGNFYPPLPFQITSIFYVISGVGYIQAVMSQAMFWLILIFSTFYLGTYLWNEDVGFLAALVSIAIPQSAFYSRGLGEDIPIAAMVPLTIFCLFKSDKFKNFQWTLFFFIAFAVGMLLKWVFVVFIFIPMLAFLFIAVKNEFQNPGTRKEAVLFIVLTPVFMAAFIFGLILLHKGSALKYSAGVMEAVYFIFIGLMFVVFALMTYLIKFKSDKIKNISRGIVLFLGLTAHFTIMHLIPMREIYRVRFWNIQYKLLLPLRTPYHFFVKFLVYHNFGLILFILLIIGIIMYFIRKARTFEKSLLLASMAFCIVFLYIQPIYDSRYFIPLNGIAALFIVFWILDLKKRYVKIPLIALVVLLCAFYIFGWIFVPDPVKAVGIRMGMLTHAPDATENRMDESANALLNLYRNDRPQKGMLIVVKDDSPGREITPLLLLYYLRKMKKMDEQVILIYKGADPVFPCREEPWGFFITQMEEEPDESESDRMFYLKDIHKDSKGQEKDVGRSINIKDRFEGIDINKVEAGTVYFCRFRTPQDNERFPSNLLNVVREKPLEYNEKPIESIKLLKDVIMEIYNMRNGR